MKKLFSMLFKLVRVCVKGIVIVALLAFVFVNLGLNRDDGDHSSVSLWESAELEALEQENQQLRERINELLLESNTEYRLLERVSFQLFPGLELDWLEFECYNHWNVTSRNQYEQTEIGEEEIVFSSDLIEWSITIEDMETC